MAAKKSTPRLRNRRKTAKAKQRRKIAAIGYDQGLVAVLMSFASGEPQRVYAAIRDECRKLGLRPQRADENAGAGNVVDEITKLIEDAEFIICDLTRGRPNVYYELGYAHGVGNEGGDIILVAKRGSRIHFDVRGLRVRQYQQTRDLRVILRADLARLIAARV